MPRPVLVFICVLITAQLNAQSSAESQKRYMRLLSWTAEPHASGYIVLIERKKAQGGFETYTEKRVLENELYYALHEGSYRYSVAALNSSGGRTAYSEWIYFECTPPPGAKKRGESNRRGAAFHIRSVSVCYPPMLPISGDMFKVIISSNFYPQGAGINAAFTIYHASFGDFGASFELDWNYLYGVDKSWDIQNTVSANLINIEPQLTFRRFVYHKMIDVNVSLDAGYNVIMGTRKAEGIEDHSSTFLFFAGAGFFAGYHVTNNIVVYAGTKISFLFSPEERPPVYLRPALSVGWSFE
ncbi:MAG: hypothetical protein LBG79_00170 [Spirochaetaceae bacterium]|jgi:hypothetical protein|nr:hypothetical protein [Spirochaetaceae bacterium]